MSAGTGSRDFSFILASARPQGNAEALARAAAAALPAATPRRWLRLAEMAVPPFADIRHEAGTYPEPTGDLAVLAEATLAATDLVIVSPVYWYNLSAQAKGYLDHWSGWLRVPGMAFKARMAGKRLWGITISSDEPGRDADICAPLAHSLRLSAQYMGMHWAGLLVGHGSRPGDIDRDAAALAQARDFFG